MQNDPTPVTGSFDRVRLHVLHWLPESAEPSAAWLMEVADVDWEPPQEWPAELERAVSTPGGEGNRLTFRVDEGAVLDIVARTAKGAARLIADLHHVSSLLETWAKLRGPSHTDAQPHISDAVAEEAVLFVLKSHFATDADAIDSVDIDSEPADEWLLHVRSGSQQYVGTVTQQGRLRVSHVTKRTDP
jgi:hypothetical protein